MPTTEERLDALEADVTALQAENASLQGQVNSADGKATAAENKANAAENKADALEQQLRRRRLPGGGTIPLPPSRDEEIGIAWVARERAKL